MKVNELFGRDRCQDCHFRTCGHDKTITIWRPFLYHLKFVTFRQHKLYVLKVLDRILNEYGTSMIVIVIQL